MDQARNIACFVKNFSGLRQNRRLRNDASNGEKNIFFLSLVQAFSALISYFLKQNPFLKKHRPPINFWLKGQLYDSTSF